MKAICYDRYGSPDVLELRELPDPPFEPGLARVRVHAAALNPKDLLLREGKLRWLIRGDLPRVPGYDLAGELLDEAGGLPRGTKVFGMIQAHTGGSCAEIARLPASQLARMPEGLSFEEAAALPLASLTALQALRDELGLRAGQRVLLNGASGGVGASAVQIAKAMGAEVVAVCSARNGAFVQELGADRAIDYRSEDVTAERGLDHVFDIYGNLPWADAKAMLRAGGRYCTTVPKPGAIARGALRRLGVHRAALVVVKSNRADLDQIRAWVEAEVLRPVVDTVVGLADSAAGHQRLATRHVRGKVVVRVGP